MSNFVVYEDQENRVPGLPPKHVRNVSQNNILQQQKSKSNLNVLQNKRTVLSTITVNAPNVRVQPRRAAKQGVFCDSDAAQVYDTADDDFQKSKSASNLSSSIPSFTIHEDSSSSSFSNMSSLSSSSSTTTTTSNQMGAPFAACFQNTSSVSGPKVGGLCVLPQVGGTTCQGAKGLRTRDSSPVKAKAKVKTKSMEGKGVDKSNMCVVEVATPEGMDISLCEGATSHMKVDTPVLPLASLPLPQTDILRRKDLDIWDVPEYASDIYQYLREAEICHKPRPNYMVKQTDITASMRWILVDWLVEVAEEYSLHTETLYLAVSYIDRFLSHMSVKRDKLQLVGTTAMFIASKYEEIYPPEVTQFAYITDNTYRVSQILRMEHLILKVLSFDMAVPTPFVFVNYYTTLAKSTDETAHLAMFLSELSMLDCDPFLRYLPSKIAASALALANFTQGTEAWPWRLAESSKYSLDDLKECYVNLHRCFCRVHEPSQHAIRDKYKAAKLSSVSLLSPREKFPW